MAISLEFVLRVNNERANIVRLLSLWPGVAEIGDLVRNGIHSVAEWAELWV